MKILDGDYTQIEEIARTRKRLVYHHKLIILYEIVSDVKLFKHLKDPEAAIDY